MATLLLLTTAAHAERTKVTSVEGITEYRYDNGLQLLLFPDSSKPTVTVNVTYFVGSRHEGRGETGMAHLLEHMVFKGTPDHADIWKQLEEHGARFNGTTWVDRTNYYETLPTTEPGNLEWALRMEADRMINSFIRREDLDTEMTVVRNEFEAGENNPTGILMARIQSAAYLWHNYGKSTIGSKSDIERVPIKNLKAFYKRYYQPDNAMLVIAGDFKTDHALKLADKYFGSIPRPKRQLDDTYTIEPQQDGARHVELRRTGDVAACGVVYHICSASHPDFPALAVVQQVLTAEPAGRLYKGLVESGMAASVFGVAFGWKEPGVILNMASVRLENPVEPVLEKMTQIIEGLSKNTITDEEIKRAKTKLLKNIDMALKNSQRIAVMLSNSAASGDWRLFFLHRDRLESLKPEDVRRVAAHYFKRTNRTSGIFHPTQDIDRTDVPRMPDLVALLKDYKGKEALSQGEEFEATPENIERRVRRYTLANGMKLALLSKETRGDAVNARLTLRFGTEADIQGRQAAISLLPDMLMRGTKKYTYQQIQDRFDELKATVNMFGGDSRNGGSVGVRIRTDREHLAETIELVAEILQHPTFPADQFEIVKKENLAGIERQLSQPTALGFNSIMRRLSPWPSDDVRYRPTFPEMIERVKAVQLDTLKKIHGRLLGASYAQLTVVGDFDETRIREVTERLLGGWKSPKPFQRIVQRFRGDVKGSDDVIETPDKKMGMVACALNLELRDDDPDYPAMHLTHYVLGASAKSRLLNRLRHKEGLSYGAGAMFAAHSQDRDGMLAGYAICASENAHKAYDSLLDEFGILLRDGIGGTELTEAKKSFALKVKTQWANDGAVVGMLNNGLYLGRTMDYYKGLYEKIDQLTSSQIQSALKKHLNLQRLVKVKAGDLQAAAASGDGGS
ncbi:MAG: insulinase family protein [Planctomycetes bacterium]|nr:insulinase family protein [Planctomycetota bacterium]